MLTSFVQNYELLFRLLILNSFTRSKSQFVFAITKVVIGIYTNTWPPLLYYFGHAFINLVTISLFYLQTLMVRILLSHVYVLAYSHTIFINMLFLMIIVALFYYKNEMFVFIKNEDIIRRYYSLHTHL